MALVMIVDDHADSRDGVAAMYRVAGHKAVVARHGREALEMLQSGASPDLVLLDLMMPVMDGLSFLELLRANPAWKDLHVVIHTGYDQGIKAERLQELGVGEIILKAAVDPTRLLSLVNCESRSAALRLKS